MKELFKLLEEIQKFLEEVQGCPAAALNTSSKIRTSLLMMVDATKQQRMKVVFLGNTSNGKSTVINALVKSKVLPVGNGSITSCFCTITGIPPSEGGDGYVKIGDRQEKLAVRHGPCMQISCCVTILIQVACYFCMPLDHFAESERNGQLHE